MIVAVATAYCFDSEMLVYSKSTYTDQHLQFDTHHPLQQKLKSNEDITV